MRCTGKFLVTIRFQQIKCFKFENLKELILALINLFTKPMLNRSTNCILISSVICKVRGFFSLRFASFYPSKALKSVMWSLHKNVYKVIQNFIIIINILKLIFNPKMCNQRYILECCRRQREEQTFSYNHDHMA